MSEAEIQFLKAFEMSQGYAFIVTFKRREKVWKMSFPQRIVSRSSSNAPGGGKPLVIKAATIHELLSFAATMINETSSTVLTKKANL